MAYSFDDLVSATDVSRETAGRLKIYGGLLVKWQAAINLVAPSTLSDLWRRHFLDSAQLYPLIPNKTAVIADLGTGAGFPGMVLAIMGATNVNLIESDQKKIAFLREVARETQTAVTLHAARIETVRIPDVSIVTARALAPLTDLLAWQDALGAKEGFFLKGAQAEEEVEIARKSWKFSYRGIKSISDSNGLILHLQSVSRETE